ncbi:MAG: porin [Burkholderiaceae bacterium]|nr:porin [Burkholderiaceae bacterium]
MKKSLVALAALAVVGVASAQSSVTLFGVVDATWAHGSGSGAGSSSKTQLTHSGLTTSRLGFRGTEDLGGGMSASFWLEAAVINDDGSGAATNTNNQATGAAPAGALVGRQGLTFGRRSTVSLAGNWGELRAGRDYTPHFWTLTEFDPFGTLGVGSTLTLVSTIGGVTAVRASNSVGYLTPNKLGGFSGWLQHYRGENNQIGAVTDKDGTGTSLRIGYAAGPAKIYLATGTTKYATGDIRQSNLGASYDFKVVNLMAQVTRERVSSAVAVAGRGALIGGHIPVGGAGLVRLAYSTYRTDAGASPKSTKIALGYVHNLSKRTALYTTYARVRNSGGAAVGLNGAVTAASSNSSGYDIGFRHSF